MLTLNLFDSNFLHAAGSVGTKTPRLVRWVREQRDWDGITVFTDQQFSQADHVRSPVKIWWLHEGRELHPEMYEFAPRYAHKFDAVLTYDQTLLDLGEPFVFTPRGGVWTPREQWGVYPKSKHVSMILSEKRTLSGHQLRHEIAAHAADWGIDLYGPEYTPIGTDKTAALRDYRYSIVVEASRERNFFSEHLLDCIAFGTVPIYWGCPNIGDFLNEAGLLCFEQLEDVPELLQVIIGHANLFSALDKAVAANLACLDEYEITEDWQARHVYPRFSEVTA